MATRKGKATEVIAVIACAALVAAGLVVWRTRAGDDTADTGVAYVQTVRSLQDGMESSDTLRFTGVVESQETVSVKADAARTIAQFHVAAGDTVSVGSPLFTYDVTTEENAKQSAALDIEGYQQNITALGDNITDLTAARKASTEQSVIQEYTAQIQSAQMQIRQAQLQIQEKNNEIAGYQRSIDSATVTSPAAGTVRTVDTSATAAASGSAVVAIQQAGDYRVKGTVSEQNLSQVSQGTTVAVRSRDDESLVRGGTVTGVDTEPQTADSLEGVYGSGSDDAASTYGFTVALTSTEGLFLGEHVYIEPAELNDDGTPAEEGIWLNDSFVVFDTDGTRFVWKDSNGRLVKQPVTVGAADAEKYDMYTIPIESGLELDDRIAYPSDDLYEGMATRMAKETQ